jgi:hypothetical protein
VESGGEADGGLFVIIHTYNRLPLFWNYGLLSRSAWRIDLVLYRTKYHTYVEIESTVTTATMEWRNRRETREG